MTDLQRSKSIVDSLYYDDGAISQSQYNILMGVLDGISPEHPAVLDKIATDLWEGCHGADQNDRSFWVNGFKSGYNYCKSTGKHIDILRQKLTKKKEKDVSSQCTICGYLGSVIEVMNHVANHHKT